MWPLCLRHWRPAAFRQRTMPQPRLARHGPAISPHTRELCLDLHTQAVAEHTGIHIAGCHGAQSSRIFPSCQGQLLGISPDTSHTLTAASSPPSATYSCSQLGSVGHQEARMGRADIGIRCLLLSSNRTLLPCRTQPGLIIEDR